MPQRVTDPEVKAILDTSIDTTPFITLASLQIDQHLASAGLSAALLKELERWLAAHLACIRDPRFTQVRTEGDAFTYEQGKMGMGLQATRYGQQVLAMDPTGILADVTTTQRASFKVD